MKKNNYLIIMFGKNECINIENAIYMSKLKRDFLYIDSSTDGTQELLKKNKIRFINHTFLNWPLLRQEGYKYARNHNFEWILMLDADEKVSKDILDDLDNLDTKNFDSYSFNFQMFFCGKKLNYITHRPRIRFFSVEKTYPQGDTIVDFISSTNNKLLPKRFTILNNDKTDFITLIQKQVDRVKNSSLENHIVIDEHGKLKKMFLKAIEKRALIKSFLYFSYHYFLKLGFMDGITGFYYCFNYAFIFLFLISAKKNLGNE